ncbi:MAG TPA: diguanylate cyclase [Candidatus Acidoferrales bacterium]|jgi:diguanylate cyclase (GGDEF)-like protein|nr:diguanylate cyclase [Candidatus Acidoferrales bacterium]
MDKSNTAAIDPTLSLSSHSSMVLLVDDQAMVAEALRRVLSDKPEIDLHYCSDPIEAIKTANKIKPTVILQDWFMPSIDGRDLLHLFRSNPSTMETPIIVLSTEESPDIKSQAFEAGANDYLVKLPDKSELLARIQYHSKACLNRIQRDEAFRTLRESQQNLSESNVVLISLNRRLEETHQKLNAALQEAEQRTREAVRLTELMDVLQSCHTVEEAYKITGDTLPDVLPAQSGALCITSPSRNLVEAVATWGHESATEKTFAPENCWALRRGRIHMVDDPDSPLRCPHVHPSTRTGHICIPLAAQGETLGVLYLECAKQTSKAGFALADLGRQAIAAGERISLALANLTLREVLRSQSIRDSLTGLFNRRYMEESLEREIRRAVRNKEHVAVLMIDIDHFKQFNDTFGHQAGDALLRELGTFLNQRTRGQDLACRFGGEEFAVILAGASLEAARKRGELLCGEVRQLSVLHAGQILGKITLSIGISGFPGHGNTAEELLRSADQALYRAKSEGRDRMVVALSQ